MKFKKGDHIVVKESNGSIYAIQSIRFYKPDGEFYYKLRGVKPYRLRTIEERATSLDACCILSFKHLLKSL